MRSSPEQNCASALTVAHAVGSETLAATWSMGGAPGDPPDEDFFRRMSPPENEIPVALPFEHGRGRGSQLLVGVELSDGRRASNVTGPPFGQDPSGLIFHQAGGSGGQLAVDQSWWLPPAPPDGPVRFICRCAAVGIEETTIELDGSELQRAAERVTTLWPWQPPDRGERPPPPPPDLPSGSWFAGPS